MSPIRVSSEAVTLGIRCTIDCDGDSGLKRLSAARREL